MKLAAVCITLIMVAATTAAEAGNGNAYGHDKRNSDGGTGNNGNTNGNAGSSSGNAGDANGNANGQDQDKATDATVYSPEGLITTGADQNIALDAVKSGDALPLDRIEPIALRQWGGRVIDAHLLKVRGTLLYKLTVISDVGVSRRVYYDARTGASVGAR